MNRHQNPKYDVVTEQNILEAIAAGVDTVQRLKDHFSNYDPREIDQAVTRLRNRGWIENREWTWINATKEGLKHVIG